VPEKGRFDGIYSKEKWRWGGAPGVDCMGLKNLFSSILFMTQIPVANRRELWFNNFKHQEQARSNG
jgi:hypothetical protein